MSQRFEDGEPDALLGTGLARRKAGALPGRCSLVDAPSRFEATADCGRCLGFVDDKSESPVRKIT